MRKHRIAAVCMASALVLSGISGCAKQTVPAEESRAESSTQINIQQEDKQQETSRETEPDAERTESEDIIRLQGTVYKIEDGSISVTRPSANGEQEEVLVQFDPENILILDSVSGFPAELSTIKEGDRIHAYVGPTMTLSEPAHLPAVMILTNISEDDAAPEYIIAAKPLAEDGQGGYILTGRDRAEVPIPADCEIIPYLTRQVVKLSDITEGRRLLVWKDANRQAKKIVLFNED